MLAHIFKRPVGENSASAIPLGILGDSMDMQFGFGCVDVRIAVKTVLPPK
jgi:hypothetical protein